MLGDPQTGVMALLGCSSATLLARSVGLERGFVSDGLAGYNGALVGCALSVFQPALPLMPAALGALGPFSSGALGDLLLTLLVGGLSAPVAAKLGPLMAPVPQWTVVFNVLALTVLSGCAAIKYLSSPQSPSKPRKPKQPKQRDCGPGVGHSPKSSKDLIRLIKEHPSHFIGDLIEAMMVSVSQIFVVNSPLTGPGGFRPSLPSFVLPGLLITVGIFCYSPAAAGLTLGGAMLGNLSALISGIDYDQVMEGLWGYNAALSSLAVGIFFVPRGLPYAGLVAAGAVGSTMVTVAVKQLMDLADLPCMTVPFCLMASACFLLGGRVLANAPGFEEVKAQGTGASVRVEGEVVESPAKGQAVEISCSSAEHRVEVLGAVDSKAYPLAKKKHSIEYLREIAHLRPRSNLIGAVSRVRNCLAMSTHQFFQDRGFLYVHTPIITTADCEGAGEMFRVSQEKAESEPKEEEEFFGRKAYLTVSGQLAVENYCCGLGDVYTFGPTFRAENSSTTRHLAEFWMIEPEMAFANLEDDMDCAEAYIRQLADLATAVDETRLEVRIVFCAVDSCSRTHIRYCVSNVLEKCKSDVDFFTLRVDKEVKECRAEMSYTEAVEVLQKHIEQGDVKFEFEVAWGKELQTEHERFLTDHVCKGPVIVYNYPKECKAFYMRLNEDGKTVAAMDVLCPGIGELVGGSQREERMEVLDERIEASASPAGLEWAGPARKPADAMLLTLLLTFSIDAAVVPLGDMPSCRANPVNAPVGVRNLRTAVRIITCVINMVGLPVHTPKPTVTFTTLTTTSLTTLTTTSQTTLSSTTQSSTTPSTTTVSSTTVSSTSWTTVTSTTVSSTTTRTTTSRTTVTSTSRTTLTSTSLTTVTSTSITTVTYTTVTFAPLKVAASAEVQIGDIQVRSTPRCPGVGPKWVRLTVRGVTRSVWLLLPKGRQKTPLWLAYHGTDNEVEPFLRYSGLATFAQQHRIGLLAPQGLPDQSHFGKTQFNVGLHSKPMREEEEQGMHDVAFTRELLEQVLRLPCIDPSRVHCTGYSNGARFCMRLASEMSDIIASVAPVSGLRFPQPNLARRPVPVLAFHGDADPINPFPGHGADYWHSSVPDALQNWAKFNGCGAASLPPNFLPLGVQSPDFSVATYEHCKDNATVQLFRCNGGGHQWPDATWAKPGLGNVGRLDANSMMKEFFSQHRLPHGFLMEALKLRKRKLLHSRPRAGAGGHWNATGLLVAAALAALAASAMLLGISPESRPCTRVCTRVLVHYEELQVLQGPLIEEEEQGTNQLGLPKEDYWWYRDLRRYGSVPHAGFGLGFERLVMLATGVQNIRDVIPFPRYPGHAEPSMFKFESTDILPLSGWIPEKSPMVLTRSSRMKSRSREGLVNLLREAGDPRETRGLPVLCYVIFLGTFEWGMVIPTLFPLLQRMDAPATYFGLIIGTFSLTRMLCQPLVVKEVGAARN
eukprot:g17095.t1